MSNKTNEIIVSMMKQRSIEKKSFVNFLDIFLTNKSSMHRLQADFT